MISDSLLSEHKLKVDTKYIKFDTVKEVGDYTAEVNLPESEMVKLSIKISSEE